MAYIRSNILVILLPAVKLITTVAILKIKFSLLSLFVTKSFIDQIKHLDTHNAHENCKRKGIFMFTYFPNLTQGQED